MNKAVPIALVFRVVLVTALVVIFGSGCSKHEDDCSAPETSEDQGSTRAYVSEDGQNAINDARPMGATTRGAEEGDGDVDGDGINDDGDDEADGEGNKKGRTQN